MNLNLPFYYCMLFSYLCQLKKNQTELLNPFNRVIALVFNLNLDVSKTASVYLGIKRGILYRWINERRIKSVLLREQGNRHGIRLIYLQSVRDYLYENMEQSEVKNEEMALTA